MRDEARAAPPVCAGAGWRKAKENMGIECRWEKELGSVERRVREMTVVAVTDRPLGEGHGQYCKVKICVSRLRGCQSAY